MIKANYFRALLNGIIRKNKRNEQELVILSLAKYLNELNSQLKNNDFDINKRVKIKAELIKGKCKLKKMLNNYKNTSKERSDFK